MKSNFNSGIDAEKIAEDYLIKKGFSILFKRAKTPYGEVDLILEKENLLVFVEVKFRTEEQVEVISQAQKKRIINACQFLISKYPLYQNKDIRFDAVIISGKTSGIISGTKGKLDVNHIENAWGEDW
jgi:putative endonuclease